MAAFWPKASDDSRIYEYNRSIPGLPFTCSKATEIVSVHARQIMVKRSEISSAPPQRHGVIVRLPQSASRKYPRRCCHRLSCRCRKMHHRCASTAVASSHARIWMPPTVTWTWRWPAFLFLSFSTFSFSFFLSFFFGLSFPSPAIFLGILLSSRSGGDLL